AYFPAPQVRRATSLVPLATLPGLLTHARLLSGSSSTPSQLSRGSGNLAGSTNPCALTFLHRKFAEPDRSCHLQPCRVLSPGRVYFSASQVRGDTSLSSCSTCHLARASCNLARCANPCTLTFRHRKFAEPPRSCLLQPWRGYFPAPQVRLAISLVPFAILSGLLTRASLLSCIASSLSHLARASCNLAGYANPCELTYQHLKFSEPPLSCLLQHCRGYFPAPQVRLAISLVPFAILSGLLTRASLLSCIASSLSHLARASCNLAGYANPCELTYQHLKFSEPPLSCLLQHCRGYFPAPQVRLAISLVPFAILSGLLTRASLLSCIASSLSHLARASCNLAGYANPCELTYQHLKFSEPPLSCLLQHCRGYFPAPQVRLAISLVPFAILSGLLTRASLLSCIASSLSHLARASCNLAGYANPCELTYQHLKFSEPPLSCLLQHCRGYFPAPQVRLAISLVPFAILSGLLTRASLLSCIASSLSHLARASCNLAGYANPCELTYQHLKFSEPPLSCLLQHCRGYFPAPQVRLAISLVPFAILSGLLTRASLLSCIASSLSHLARASCNLAGYANPCELTYQHLKFSEPPLSCLLQHCRGYFPAPQVRLAISLVPFAILSGLLTRASLLSCIASSLSHLARASCNLAGYANPCELTYQHLKFSEPPLSCLLQHCRGYFPAPQVRLAISLVPFAILSGLLTRASLLSCIASSLSHLARASCNLAGSANPCEITFRQLEHAEPTLSWLLQPYRIYKPVRAYIPAPQVCRACSLVPLATLPGLVTRASLLFCIASSRRHLALLL
ncbi:hypothetical protein CRG98_016487, partial [Punica granatum]